MRCSSCGADAPTSARFCPSCGHALATDEERRVVSVVFADLVGFTALSEGADPERVKRLVDRCFARLADDVTSFGGRVDKVMGDGLLALFGAPVAHEDDAERAVRSSLRMLGTMAELDRDARPSISRTPLQLRIGINTGEVLTGALRAGGDYTAMGDVVNTASRLQSLAEPGTIVIGETTRARLGEAVACAPLGAVDLRGRAEAVQAWRVLGATAPPGLRRRIARAALIGRSLETGVVAAALDSAVRSRRPQLIVLSGDVGVGKNRLSDEVLAAAAERHDALRFEGRCLPYGESNVWWPFAEMLRRAYALIEPRADSPSDANDPDHERERISAMVGTRMSEADAAERQRVVDALCFLLDHPDALGELEPTRAREEAATAIARLLEAVATDRPVFLRLLDLQWADDEVLELIGAVLVQLSRVPVALVVTTRPELADRWSAIPLRAGVLVVHVDPLSPDDTATLADKLAGKAHPLTDEVRSALVTRSGGNPYFLEELVGLVTRSGAGVPDGALPESLRAVLAARIDRLPPDVRHLLQDAAVFGRTGHILSLERMTEAQNRPTGQVRASVATLVSEGLLELTGERWAFSSNLVREAAYSMLTKGDRADKHAGIAAWFEANADGTSADTTPQRIARNYATAARLEAELQPGSRRAVALAGKALDWLDRVVTRAMAVGFFPQVEEQARTALELDPIAPSPERRLRMLLALGRAHLEQHEPAAARPVLADALRLADSLGDNDRVASAHLQIADLHMREGRYDEARAEALTVEERFASLDNKRGLAQALRLQGMIALRSNRPAEVGDVTRRALLLFRELDDRRGQAWALQNLAWEAFFRDDPGEAESNLQAALELFRAIGDGQGEGWSRGMMGWVRYQQGDLEAAARLSTAAIEVARRHRDRWAEAMLTLLLGAVWLWSGETEKAELEGDRAVEAFERLDDPIRLDMARAVNARARLRRGRPDLALTMISAHSEEGEGFRKVLAADLGDPGLIAARSGGEGEGEHHEAMEQPDTVVVESEIAGALLDVQRGRPHRALPVLAKGMALDSGARTWALAVTALAESGIGKTSDARATAAVVVDDQRATYQDRLVALLAAGLSHARDGDDRSALASFDKAAAVISPTEDLLGRALLTLARAAAGHARGWLDQVELEAELRQRLAALGVELTGWRRAFDVAAGTVAAL